LRSKVKTRCRVAMCSHVDTTMYVGKLADYVFEEKEEGLRLSACVPSRCPLQPPGAAGLVSGGVVTQI
jgi:hypothetical protein